MNDVFIHFMWTYGLLRSRCAMHAGYGLRRRRKGQAARPRRWSSSGSATRKPTQHGHILTQHSLQRVFCSKCYTKSLTPHKTHKAAVGAPTATEFRLINVEDENSSSSSSDVPLMSWRLNVKDSTPVLLHNFSWSWNFIRFMYYEMQIVEWLLVLYFMISSH